MTLIMNALGEFVDAEDDEKARRRAVYGCARAVWDEPGQRRSRAKPVGKDAVCAICGAPFKAYSHNAKYCSLPCKRAAALERDRRRYRR